MAEICLKGIGSDQLTLNCLMSMPYCCGGMDNRHCCAIPDKDVFEQK
jgi:hypothetical protein